MDIFKVNREDDGQIDSCGALILRTFIISLLNIVDLVLTIISFDSEFLIFFILKYVTISLTFVMHLSWCYLYSYTAEEMCDNFFYLLISVITAIIVLGLEIAVLVYFIKYFNDLNLLIIIGYFIHWIPPPLSIIIGCTHDFFS